MVSVRRGAVVAVAFGAAAGTGVLVASAASGGDSTITGCTGKRGALRIVKKASSCSKTERVITFSSRGPVGPAGVAGPAGPVGAAGAAGAVGAAGASASAPSVGDLFAQKWLLEGSSTSATTVILHVDGIQGESTNAKYTNDIDIEGVVWGASDGRGTPTSDELTLTKRLDKATPKLLQRMVTGTPINAQLIYIKTGGVSLEYLTISLPDAIVASDELLNQSERPRERVDLRVRHIDVVYKAENASGGLEAPTTFTYDFPG